MTGLLLIEIDLFEVNISKQQKSKERNSPAIISAAFPTPQCNQLNIHLLGKWNDYPAVILLASLCFSIQICKQKGFTQLPSWKFELNEETLAYLEESGAGLNAAIIGWQKETIITVQPRYGWAPALCKDIW